MDLNININKLFSGIVKSGQTTAPTSTVQPYRRTALTVLTTALYKLAFNYDLPESQYFCRASTIQGLGLNNETSIEPHGDRDDQFLLQTRGQSNHFHPNGSSEVHLLDHNALIQVFHITQQNDVVQIQNMMKNVEKFRASPHITDHTNKHRWAAACESSWLNSNDISQIPKFADLSTTNAEATIIDFIDCSKQAKESYVFICMDPSQQPPQQPPQQPLKQPRQLPQSIQLPLTSPHVASKIAWDLVMAMRRFHASGISFNGDFESSNIYIPEDIKYPVSPHVLFNNISAGSVVINDASKANDYKKIGKIIVEYYLQISNLDDFVEQSRHWFDWGDGKLFSKLLTTLLSLSTNDVEKFEQDCDSGKFGVGFILNQRSNTTPQTQDQLANKVLSLLKTGKAANVPYFDRTRICSSCKIAPTTTIKSGAFWSGVETTCDHKPFFIKWTTNPEHYSEFKGFAKIIKHDQKSHNQPTNDGPVKHDMYYYSPFHNVLITTMECVDDTIAKKVQKHIAVVDNPELGQSSELLSADDIVNYINAVERAITNLHSKYQYNVAHHDIKWENIHIVEKDGNYHAKLLDLGSCVPFDPCNGVLQYNGTPAPHSPLYAAPEINQPHATCAVDWFSLGLCALELIIGRNGISLETYFGDLASMKFEDDAYQLLRYNLTFDKYHQNFQGFPEDFINKLRLWLSHNPNQRQTSVDQSTVSYQSTAQSGPPPPRLLVTKDRDILQDIFQSQFENPDRVNIVLRYAMLPHFGYRHSSHPTSSEYDSIVLLYSPTQDKFFKYAAGLITNKPLYRASADLHNDLHDPQNDLRNLHLAKNNLIHLLADNGLLNEPKFLFATETANNDKNIECVAPFAAMWAKSSNVPELTTATPSNVTNSNPNPHNITYFKTQTIGRYSISNRTDIKKDKRDVYSYKTDPARLAAAMFTQNGATETHATYSIARNIAALSDIINITSDQFKDDLGHLGATEDDFDQFQTSFSDEYSGTTAPAPEAFLPLLNDAYWKRLADRHLLQAIRTRCVEPTHLNDMNNNQQDLNDMKNNQQDVYIDRMKRQAQLLPIEFGQHYLKDHFEIESVVLQCEPKPSDYRVFGRYVWQVLASDQPGVPSHVKIWVYDQQQNRYIDHDPQTKGLCVLYCIAHVACIESGSRYPNVDDALDDLLLSFDEQLFGYLRRITQRIKIMPTAFDKREFIDKLFGYYVASQLHEIPPVKNYRKLVDFFKNLKSPQNQEHQENCARFIAFTKATLGDQNVYTAWVQPPDSNPKAWLGNLYQVIDLKHVALIPPTPPPSCENAIFTLLLGTFISYEAQVVKIGDDKKISDQEKQNRISSHQQGVKTYFEHLSSWTDKTLKIAVDQYLSKRFDSPSTTTSTATNVNRAHIISCSELIKKDILEAFTGLIDSKKRTDKLKELGQDFTKFGNKNTDKRFGNLIKAGDTTFDKTVEDVAKAMKELRQSTTGTTLGNPLMNDQQLIHNDEKFRKFLKAAGKLSQNIMWAPQNVRKGHANTNEWIGNFIDPHFHPKTGELRDIETKNCCVSTSITNTIKSKEFIDPTKLNNENGHGRITLIKIEPTSKIFIVDASTADQPPNKAKWLQFNNKKSSHDDNQNECSVTDETKSSSLQITLLNNVFWVASSDASPFSILAQKKNKIKMAI